VTKASKASRGENLRQRRIGRHDWKILNIPTGFEPVTFGSGDATFDNPVSAEKPEKQAV